MTDGSVGSGGSEARRAERRQADEPSTLRGPDGFPVDVHVHDISRHGFLCEAELDLAPGDAVTLGLGPHGSGGAVVRWRDARLYGCEFVPPIDDMDVVRLSGELVGLRRTRADRAEAVARDDRLATAGNPWSSTLALCLSTAFMLVSGFGALHILRFA